MRRKFDTFFKEFTTQSNTVWKNPKNSIYTMRMFDTFFKEFTTQSNTAWKKQRTAYIWGESLIRSLKSSQHNQIQPEKNPKNSIYTMRMFDTFFKEFTTQSNTVWKNPKNSIYTMRMFDTFFKEFTTQSNTAWKKQRTAYIWGESLIRSLKSSQHNQIQPEKNPKNSIYTMRMFDTFFKEFTTQSNTAWKKQRTAYIWWECLIRSLKSSLHNQIQPEKNNEQHIYDENVWYVL